MQNIRREIIEENICVLMFDRAESSANIFDPATLNELDARLDELDEKLAGVVFISAKPAIFIAGADLTLIRTFSKADLRHFIELGQRVFSKIAALKPPTVAAIHGACVGGGYELCLACDWRIATPERATKIGLPETQLGILPAWGGSTRLPRLIGAPRALDIILGGKTVPAKQALRLGMVDQLAPRESLLRAACRAIHSGLQYRRRNQPLFARWTPLNAIAAGVAAPVARKKLLQKTRGHYPALLKALDVVTAAASSWNQRESFQRERDAILELAETDECKNLMRVFWLQERAKKLRVPGADAVTKEPGVTHAAVIGAGVMGAAIAQWLSARSIRVLLRDIDAARVAAGMARIAQLYATGVKRRIFDKREARDGMDRISPVSTETPMLNVNIIIEAAVEKMDLKKRIFTRLSETAPPDALLATNTSALSITEIASVTKNPSRVIGIHFFNPVHLMQLVEVVTGRETSAEAAQRAVRFVQKIGKLPVLVRDSPGFLVNRILLPYLVEAAHFFAMGASVTDIDEAMLDFGMPMGPLRLLDEVGLDVGEDVAATLAASFPDRMRVPPLLSKMIGADMLGKKNGRGFYVYRNGSETPNENANQFRESDAAASVERDELQRRMVLLMVNEAARCLEEKIVAEPEDVDFGMIMGTGFAPFRGGPLRFADAQGLATIQRELQLRAEVAGPHFAPCALITQMAETGGKFYADS